jgi:RimJ/RimL family protein N-acetyltransferase
MKDTRVLTFRLASAGDSDLLLAWRNDEQTRLASRTTANVTVAEHQAWLSQMLASGAHIMQIAELDRTPAGVVRAERTAEGWELSWTVAPVARGRGVGSRMLKAFVEDLNGRLSAVIRNDNVASERMAAAAGFARAGDTSDPDFKLWIRA